MPACHSKPNRHSQTYSQPETEAQSYRSACHHAGANLLPNLYVDDAAQAYVLAMKHATPGGIYHAAGGSATNRQIAEAIAEKHGFKTQSLTKAEAEQVYGPFLSFFFAKTNRPDCSKAKAELHWQPKYDSSHFLKCVAGKVSGNVCCAAPEGYL